jgi:hypothetical protein
MDAKPPPVAARVINCSFVDRVLRWLHGDEAPPPKRNSGAIRLGRSSSWERPGRLGKRVALFVLAAV